MEESGSSSGSSSGTSRRVRTKKDSPSFKGKAKRRTIKGGGRKIEGAGTKIDMSIFQALPFISVAMPWVTLRSSVIVSESCVQQERRGDAQCRHELEALDMIFTLLLLLRSAFRRLQLFL